MNRCILNGKVVEDRKIISVYNGSFLYGINCFEGMRGYWDSRAERMILLDLNHHINRLYLSAERMRLNFRLSKKELATQIRHFIHGNNLRENIYIRMTLFIDGETSWMEQNNISYLISLKTMSSNLTSGIVPDNYTLKVSSVLRNSEKATSPSIKAGGNYLNSRYARIEAQEHGFDDALMVNHQGFVAESTGSCIFFFRDGVLHTPSLNCDILPSITRKRIITLCNKNGIDVLEGAYPIDYLLSSEAAFLCGTMIELMPISRIEGVEFETRNSEIFQRILKLFVGSLSAEHI